MTDSQIAITGFEVLEKLGTGGMATVWKARQISLDRIVAIKILSAQLAADPADVQRFQKEAQAAAKLKHPGIIQVYDANAENGHYFFVMEYVAGYTVGDWIRRKGILEEKDALLVIECVADALKYAWENQKIIHCDIKPDNVMIDADGTVKVADLGLSRTISAMSSETQSEEVMGTPAYISPEQAMGLPDLDFRSDIYSLGAMLYHLLTGKLLFEGQPENKVMELQVQETVEDPQKTNPSISTAACWLLEKMLEKKKENRHSSWEEVIRDIQRVKRRHPPGGRMPEDGGSTIQRGETRKKLDHVSSGRPPTTRTDAFSAKPKGLWLGVGVGLALILLLFGLSLVKKGKSVPVPVQPVVPATPLPRSAGPSPEPTVTAPETDDLKELYEFAQSWAKKNPADFQGAIGKFETVLQRGKGTKYELMAQEDIRQCESARTKAIDEIVRGLDAEAQLYTASGDLLSAAGLYERYAGPLAEESKDKRLALGRDLRNRLDRAEAEKKIREMESEKRYDDLLNQVADTVIREGLRPALDLLKQSGPRISSRMTDLNALTALVQSACETEDEILNSFRESIGKEITVLLTGGVRTFFVMDVKGDRVLGEQRVSTRPGVVASVPVEFGIGDLQIREKLIRMGMADLPYLTLAKGVMALEIQNFERAEEYFGKTPLIGTRLVQRIKKTAESPDSLLAEKEAEAVLSRMLGTLGVNVGAFQAEVWVEALASRRLTAGEAQKAAEFVPVYREKFGTTEFCKRAEPVLAALARMMTSSGTEAPGSTVPPVVSESQIRVRPEFAGIKDNPDAVQSELLKRNRDLMSSDITWLGQPGGKDMGLQILSGNVEDLSPVGALTQLKVLICGSPWAREEGRLKDLTPIANLMLTSLTVPNCRLTDILPIKNMPLQRLDLMRTRVRDISCLKGMSLTYLDLSSTQVYDISSLGGVPLRALILSDTTVKNAVSLKGLPLTNLRLRNTKIYDFSFLYQMPLVHLDVSGTQFKDVELFKGMPLATLNVSATKVNDLSVLKGVLLKQLRMDGLSIRDYEFMEGMPLTVLSVAGTRFKDLWLVQPMPLVRVDIANTEVDDLRPLEGKELKSLNITNLKVSDLACLKGMPLEELRCQGIRAQDFGVLTRSPLKWLWIDNPESISWILRSMPDLASVNGITWEPVPKPLGGGRPPFRRK